MNDLETRNYQKTPYDEEKKSGKVLTIILLLFIIGVTMLGVVAFLYFYRFI